MALKTLVVACAVLMGMCLIASGKPDETHAFCKIIWLFGIPCEQVNMAIVTQIKAMGSYELAPVTPLLIHANHTSAVDQVETVNFTMSATVTSVSCHVEGTSVSTFWATLFDNGTNYCNLHDVIQGSGLTTAPGYSEFSNEWLCLSYGLSTCE